MTDLSVRDLNLTNNHKNISQFPASWEIFRIFAADFKLRQKSMKQIIIAFASLLTLLSCGGQKAKWVSHAMYWRMER